MDQDYCQYLESVAAFQFGPVVGNVVSLLVNKGSLSLPELTRMLPYPGSQVQAALMTLVLHNILTYGDIERGSKLIEVYDINCEELEYRTRGGLYVSLGPSEVKMGATKDRCEQILQSLFTNGMQRGDDLESTHSANGANGHAPDILVQLLRAQLISIVTPGSKLSLPLLEIKWEQELRLAIKGVISAKNLKTLKEDVAAKKEDWLLEEHRKARGLPPDDAPAAPARPNKRRKIEDSDSEGEGESNVNSAQLRTSFLRLNPERIHILLRDRLYAQCAMEKFNKPVGYILGVFFKLARPDSRISDETSRPISLTQVMGHIEHDKTAPDLSQCFSSTASFEPYKAPRKTADIVRNICDVLSGANAYGINDQSVFLIPTTRDTYVLPYQEMGRFLKKSIIESIILQKLGRICLRCWRILYDKGKLDEKHLARLAFITTKDSRLYISQLYKSHFIDCQDVPKSNDRAPGRTVYLWYVDYPRVLSEVTALHYRAMYSVLSQVSSQLATHATLLAKSNRPDVKADPARYLSHRDNESLKKLNQTLSILHTARDRIDQDVFVLKQL